MPAWHESHGEADREDDYSGDNSEWGDPPQPRRPVGPKRTTVQMPLTIKPPMAGIAGYDSYPFVIVAQIEMHAATIMRAVTR